MRLFLKRRYIPSWQLLGLFLVCVSVLSACSGSENQTHTASATTATSAYNIPAITIQARDDTFQIPAKVQAGTVSITLNNDGPSPHQATVLKLHNNIDYQTFKQALDSNPVTAFHMADDLGGINTIGSKLSQVAILKLTAGQYAIVCFVKGPDGLSHYMHGMVSPLVVTDPADSADLPQEDDALTLADYSFTFDQPLSAQVTTLKVINNGPQAHEFALVKMAPNKTSTDIFNFLKKPAGTPPFTDYGGMAALSPHQYGWIKLHLRPSTYMALCFIPDSKGTPHFMDGMFTSFTVV
ncbi:MAG TPA: hypothetical protein VGL94_22190 [Ktedonobacteraceae bacterium]